MSCNQFFGATLKVPSINNSSTSLYNFNWNCEANMKYLSKFLFLEKFINSPLEMQKHSLDTSLLSVNYIFILEISCINI